MGQVMWLLWLLQLLTGVGCWSGSKQLNSPHNLHMTGCYGDNLYMKVYHGDSKSHGDSESRVTRPVQHGGEEVWEMAIEQSPCTVECIPITA